MGSSEAFLDRRCSEAARSPRWRPDERLARALVSGYGGPVPARSDAMVKRVTLVACILGSGIALLDGTVVNVALPTIQRALCLLYTSDAADE